MGRNIAIRTASAATARLLKRHKSSGHTNRYGSSMRLDMKAILHASEARHGSPHIAGACMPKTVPLTTKTMSFVGTS